MKASISRRIFLAMAAAGVGRAQESISSSTSAPASSSDAKFSTDVKVVNLLVAVRDKQGKIINNLGKDDFDLSEEGRPQTIRYFTRETDAPLTLGLLIDTSLSQRRVLGEEKDASRRFIEKVLREDRDQTFLIHFDHDSELLQDLTSSRSKLEHALEDVQLPDDARPQLRGGGGGGGGYPGGGGGGGRRSYQAGTTLYDAVQLASDELMRKRMGRKALILMTDGVDQGSKDTLSQAIEAAQRSDTLVYSVWFTGEEQQPTQPYFGGGGGGYGGHHRGGGGYPPRQAQGPDGKKILQQISRETGGGFFEVGKKLSIDQIYDRIEEELRNQYSLGFTPDKSDSFGFHKIAVTVKQKGLIVQTREGYYPGS